MMKPFSIHNLSLRHRIFCYRLSRARRIVENAFGIMASKFRVLQTTVQLEPVKVQKIVMAVVVLHNLLRREHSPEHTPSGSLDVEDLNNYQIVHGTWRREATLNNLQATRLGGFQQKEKKFENCFVIISVPLAQFPGKTI